MFSHDVGKQRLQIYCYKALYTHTHTYVNNERENVRHRGMPNALTDHIDCLSEIKPDAHRHRPRHRWHRLRKRNKS